MSAAIFEELTIALAEPAEIEDITQRQMITRGLVAAGLPVDECNPPDRTPRRRRAA
jgi:hypothetical protein